MPGPTLDQLSDRVLDLSKEAARLNGALAPESSSSLIEIVRIMNSYYSNLIEGHNTHLLDIERALLKDYTAEPAKHARQLEAAAHVEVERLLDARIAEARRDGAGFDPMSPKLVRWIHEQFYLRMPTEYRYVRMDEHSDPVEVVPGALRDRSVRVGTHVPPEAESLPALFDHFHNRYRLDRHHGTGKLIAIAAAHHRLAWIHPFLDGNGRTVRLATHAALAWEFPGHGLWSPNRGFTLRHDRYRSALAEADTPRQGNLDGRGQLSERTLARFVDFFIATCRDQVAFMSELLEIKGLRRRVIGYVARRTAGHIPGEHSLRPEAGPLLADVLIRGEVPRGREIERITGLGERMARNLVSTLIAEGLLVSDSQKAPIRIGIPARIVEHWFPRLYMGDDNPAVRESFVQSVYGEESDDDPSLD